jgi:hypothetical protein
MARVQFPAVAKDFSPLFSVNATAGLTQSPAQVILHTLFGGLKRPGSEADHSPPCSIEVKNYVAILPLPHMSSWHSA